MKRIIHSCLVAIMQRTRWSPQEIVIVILNTPSVYYRYAGPEQCSGTLLSIIVPSQGAEVAKLSRVQEPLVTKHSESSRNILYRNTDIVPEIPLKRKLLRKSSIELVAVVKRYEEHRARI